MHFPAFAGTDQGEPPYIRIRHKPVNFEDTMGKEIIAMTLLSELD
jgi:hypothetical protein